MVILCVFGFVFGFRYALTRSKRGIKSIYGFWVFTCRALFVPLPFRGLFGGRVIAVWAWCAVHGARRGRGGRGGRRRGRGAASPMGGLARARSLPPHTNRKKIYEFD